MALDRLTKIDGGGISTTSDYRVGIITASKFVGPFDGSGGNFSGVVTATNGVFSGNISAVDGNFSGNVTIGGTLTYEDVTNIDSVGIVTARDGIDCNADLDVDGHTNLDNVSIAGVITATTYYGNGSNLTGIDATALKDPAGNVKIQAQASGAVHTGIATFQDIDVDGHTNLDNVSVAGATTCTGGAVFMNSISLNASTNNYLYFNDNLNFTRNGHGNEMIITSGGDVGINVTPISGVTLQVGTPNTSTGVMRGHPDYFSIDSGSSAGGGVVGTASNPALIFGGDGNTGLYHSAADTLNFTTGGTERLRCDADGVKTLNGRFYSAGTFAYIESSSTSTATLTLKKTASGADSIDYLQLRDNSNAIKFKISGDGILFTSDVLASHEGDTDTKIRFPAADTFSVETAGSERLRITSNGNVEIGSGSGIGYDFSLLDGVIINAANGDAGLMVNSSSSSHNAYISFSYGSGSGTSHADQFSAYIGRVGDDTLIFGTQNNLRWKIDSSGHLVPNTAGAVNIGSATAEIGDVYIANSKKAYFGSTQTLSIHNDGNNSLITDSSSAMFIRSNRILFQNSGGTEGYGEFNQNGSVYWTHDNIKRIETTATGIEVTGEVASTQDYPNQRPTLDFNFAKTKALDPRLSYIRSGPASYYDDRGLLVLVGDDTPRFDHDPMTRESKGILLEESRRNMQPHSVQYGLDGSNGWVNVQSQVYVDFNPGVVTPTGDTVGAITFKDIGGTSQHYMSTDVVTVSSGTTYTFSFFFKNISGSDANNLKITTSGGNLPYEIRSYYFSGTDIGTSTGDDTTITELPNGWWRGTYVVTASGNGNAALIFDFHALNNGAAKNNVVAIYGLQCEIGDFPTSYIPTDGNLAIRGGDTLIMTGSDLTDVFNEVEGTMFYEASLESLTRDNQPIVAFRDLGNTTGNYHAMGMRIGGGSSGNLRTWFKSSSNNEFLSNHASTGLTTKMFYKHIYGYKLSDCADAYRTATNSGIQDISHANSIGDGNPMITSGVVDELRFGGYYSLGDTYKMDAGHIKRFSYWTQKLTNTQLTTYIS